MSKLIYTLVIAWSFLILSQTPANSAEEIRQEVTVVYPAAPAPYSVIFRQIIQGIESGLDTKPIEIIVPEENTVKDSDKLSLSKQTSVVIALGRSGIQSVAGLADHTRVLVGAIDVPPGGKEKLAGVSLSINPEKYFEVLRAISPKTRRVRAVFDPDISQITIKAAQSAAANKELDLIIYYSSNIKEAIRQSDVLLQDANPETDAVWLTPDVISFNQEVLLPLYIEKSWERGLITFSTAQAHTKRGILFSLYPDYFGMGKELASLVSNTSLTSHTQSNDMQFLQSIKVSFNLRTARHIGLTIQKSLLPEFDLIYPDN